MTRERLGKIGSFKRIRVIGTFARNGQKRGWKGAVERTILLKDIRLCADNSIICDHIWLNETVFFMENELKEGDRIEFDARVSEYEKGYKGGKAEESGAWSAKDYRLSHPTKFILKNTGDSDGGQQRL